MDINEIVKKAEKKQEKGFRDRKQLTKVAIMGGTFDPIHHGHLVIAEQVRCEYQFDKVIFIPSGIPPHKPRSSVIDSNHRYRMTLLATATNPYFEVSKIEMESTKISYTINTIKALRNIYDDHVDLYFITGADAICELDTWRNVDELSQVCNFIAATRPGIELEYVQKRIEELKKKYQVCIRTIDVPALAISSTDIRKRVKEKQSIKYLLPETVEHYIYKHNLYMD